MIDALAYIPLDRRYALADETDLPDKTAGAVLFADVSGFTPLTEALLRHLGPRRGADELARHFNRVFDELIAKIDRYGGSVIGFSGDAITCWFDDDLPRGSIWIEPDPEVLGETSSGCGLLRALAAASEMQSAMSGLTEVRIGAADSVALALKISLSAGSVRRFLVGNPDIQVIEVLAGTILDRVAGADAIAQEGDIVVDEKTIAESAAQIIDIRGWRESENAQRFALVTGLNATLEPVKLPPLENGPEEKVVRSWVLPSVYKRLRSQERFLAELRPAAALFVKFSGIDYEADSDAGERLDRYVRWVQSMVDRYQGSLIQLTTGDKGSYLYIAFGAPIAHDDNAERAARAALALRNLPPELAYINRVQMGITEGRMRVGPYGGGTRQTYAVLGDATNLSARLMSRAGFGQILVNQQVADEISDQFELQDLGFATLKGKSEPEALYALLQTRMQQREQLSTRYGTPLVGRDAEIAQIEATVRIVLDGHIHIVRVEGEAGVGKSHLAATIVERGQQHGMIVWVGSCQSTGQETAYLPVRQIARQLLALPSSDTLTSAEEQQRQIRQVEATLQVMNREWLLRMPLLGDLLGLPIPDTPTTAAFEPQLRREALITLFIDMVVSAAQQRPLLILIEDIHWIDEASHELLLSLGRSLVNHPVLLMLMHRPAMRAVSVVEEPGLLGQDLPERWNELTDHTHLLLRELSPEGTAALVANRLASRTIAPLALELIQELAQGNPFYVEELVDALLDSEQLMPVGGTWILTKSVVTALRNAHCLRRVGSEWRLRQGASLAEVDLGIPDSIHGIVLARLDRLPEAVKLTLKVASVIGHLFEMDMLAEAHPAAIAEADLFEQIDLVEERDFARIETPDPQRRYIFRHNITQEVVYRTLLDEQRQDLHLAVGRAVEKFQPEAVERLAHHYYNSDLQVGDSREKALRYLGAAGDRARREYANETALAFYDRGLTLEERWEWIKSKIELFHLLGQRQEELELLDYADYIKIGPAVERALLRSIYFESISEYDAAQEAVDRALELSRRQGDIPNEARSLIQSGQIAGRKGDFAGKEQALLAALEAGKSEHLSPTEEIEIRYGLGIVYRERSEYAKAQDALDSALLLTRTIGDRSREAMILSAIGSNHRHQRQFADAHESNACALKLAQEIGDRSHESSALISIAQILLEGKGDVYQAVSSLKQALSIQNVVGSLWRKALIWNTLGVAYNDVGQYQAAEESIQRGIQIIDDIGFEAGRGHLLCNLGEAYREFKSLEKAIRILEESLSIALQHPDRATQAYSYTELAATLVLNREYERAIECAESAIDIQTKMNIYTLAASGFAVLGFAHQRLHHSIEALNYVQKSFDVLNNCQGTGPQYPQRAYLACFQTFKENGKREQAIDSLRAACRLVTQQAKKISDPTMRESFLTNVSTNRTIQDEAKMLGLLGEFSSCQ